MERSIQKYLKKFVEKEEKKTMKRKKNRERKRKKYDKRKGKPEIFFKKIASFMDFLILLDGSLIFC